MPNDLAALIPSSIVVCFPASQGGNLTTLESTVTVTLASLALPEYRGVTGAPWSKVIHRYEIATWDGVVNTSDWTNSATLTKLANQIATDWYHWQLANLDIQYVSPVPWTPDGLADIEWSQLGLVKTRLMRGPFNPQEDLLYPAPAMVNNSTVINNLFVTNEFIIYNINNNETYFEFIINYVTNTAVFNIFNTVVNFYSIVNFYETIIVSGPVIWDNPILVKLVTDVCFFPYTRQWDINTTTLINVGGSDLITATFTLAEPTTAIITGNIEWLDGTLGQTGSATLKVDGSVQTRDLPWTVPYASYDGMHSQMWVVSLAAGAHTLIFSASGFGGTVSAGSMTNLVVHTDGVLITQYQYFLLPNGVTFDGAFCTANPQLCCTTSTGSGSGSGAGACGCSQLYAIATAWTVNFTLTGCGGGGGGIVTNCCPMGLPATINLVFNGALAPLGTVTVTWNATNQAWVATKTVAACGGTALVLSLACQGTGNLRLNGTLDGVAFSAEWDTPIHCASGSVSDADQSRLTGACAGAFTATLEYGGADTIAGPVTVLQVSDCCWSGHHPTIAGVAAQLCLVANADGTTSWELTVTDGGAAVGFWRLDNGTAAVNCCAAIASIPAGPTTCASASNASATPIGCGSGSGSGSGTVTTSCCSNKIPTTLYAKLANSANCPCVSGTIALTYNATTHRWEGTGPLGSCGHNVSFSVYCNGDVAGQPCGPGATTWYIDITYPDGCQANQNCASLSVTCGPPFEATTFRILGTTCGCTSAGQYTITITE